MYCSFEEKEIKAEGDNSDGNIAYEGEEIFDHSEPSHMDEVLETGQELEQTEEFAKEHINVTGENENKLPESKNSSLLEETVHQEIIEPFLTEEHEKVEDMKVFDIQGEIANKNEMTEDFHEEPIKLELANLERLAAFLKSRKETIGLLDINENDEEVKDPIQDINIVLSQNQNSVATKSPESATRKLTFSKESTLNLRGLSPLQQRIKSSSNTTPQQLQDQASAKELTMPLDVEFSSFEKNEASSFEKEESELAKDGEEVHKSSNNILFSSSISNILNDHERKRSRFFYEDRTPQKDYFNLFEASEKNGFSPYRIDTEMIDTEQSHIKEVLYTGFVNESPIKAITELESGDDHNQSDLQLSRSTKVLLEESKHLLGDHNDSAHFSFERGKALSNAAKHPSFANIEKEAESVIKVKSTIGNTVQDLKRNYQEKMRDLCAGSLKVQVESLDKSKWEMNSGLESRFIGKCQTVEDLSPLHTRLQDRDGSYLAEFGLTEGEQSEMGEVVEAMRAHGRRTVGQERATEGSGDGRRSIEGMRRSLFDPRGRMSYDGNFENRMNQEDSLDLRPSYNEEKEESRREGLGYKGKNLIERLMEKLLEEADDADSSTCTGLQATTRNKSQIMSVDRSVMESRRMMIGENSVYVQEFKHDQLLQSDRKLVGFPQASIDEHVEGRKTNPEARPKEIDVTNSIEADIDGKDPRRNLGEVITPGNNDAQGFVSVTELLEQPQSTRQAYSSRGENKKESETPIVAGGNEAYGSDRNLVDRINRDKPMIGRDPRVIRQEIEGLHKELFSSIKQITLNFEGATLTPKKMLELKAIQDKIQALQQLSSVSIDLEQGKQSQESSLKGIEQKNHQSDENIIRVNQKAAYSNSNPPGFNSNYLPNRKLSTSSNQHNAQESLRVCDIDLSEIVLGKIADKKIEKQAKQANNGSMSFLRSVNSSFKDLITQEYPETDPEVFPHFTKSTAAISYAHPKQKPTQTQAQAQLNLNKAGRPPKANNTFSTPVKNGPTAIFESVSLKRSQIIPKVSSTSREKSNPAPKEKQPPIEIYKPVVDPPATNFQNVIKKLSFPKNLSTYTQPLQEDQRDLFQGIANQDQFTNSRQPKLACSNSTTEYNSWTKGSNNQRKERVYVKAESISRKKSFGEERKPSAERNVGCLKERKNSACYSKTSDSDYAYQSKGRMSVENLEKSKKSQRDVCSLRRDSSSDRIMGGAPKLLHRSSTRETLDGAGWSKEEHASDENDQVEMLNDEIKRLDARLAAAKGRSEEVTDFEALESDLRGGETSHRFYNREMPSQRTRRGSDASGGIINSRRSLNFSSRNEKKSVVLDDIIEAELRDGSIATESDYTEQKRNKLNYNSFSAAKTRDLEDDWKKQKVMNSFERGSVKRNTSQGVRTSVFILYMTMSNGNIGI